ncbi:MAG: hypothetical protein AAF750_15470 [Planctomycetota bacterium]
MKSRATQLLARYIAKALAAVSGGSLIAEAPVLTIASGLVALAAAAADLLIHKAETGAISAPAGTPKT